MMILTLHNKIQRNNYLREETMRQRFCYSVILLFCSLIDVAEGEIYVYKKIIM